MKSSYSHLRVLGLLSLLAISSSAASAQTAGQLSIAGGDTFTNTTIDFTGPFFTIGDTGEFSGLNLGTVSFASGPQAYTGTGIIGDLFSITGATPNTSETATYFSSGDTFTLTPYPVAGGGTDLSLTINSTGFFTGNYFSGELPATFTITSQGEPSPSGSMTATVTFSGTGVAAVPEPTTSLLFGAGLAAAACLLFWRRSSGVMLRA